MKKLFGLFLVGVMCVLGSGCGREEGVYKFDSVEVTIGENTTTYSCSKDDKSNVFTGQICSSVEGITIELKDDEKIIIQVGEEAEEGFYKIEDEKLFLRLDENKKWREIGIIKNDTIEYKANLGVNVVVILKK